MRLPIQVRHEAAFELAKLMLWLEIEHREEEAAFPIDQIAPDAEGSP